MGIIASVMSYFMRRDRSVVDKSFASLSEESKNMQKTILLMISDAEKYKAYVAENYVSRNTLMELIVRPNDKAHEEIKGIVSEMHNLLSIVVNNKGK